MFRPAMLGTMLNAGGILLGGALGLAGRRSLSVAAESWFKVVLAVLTVFYGLRTTLQSLEGSPGQVLKQIGIVLLALVLGNIVGRLARIQKLSNRIGQRARERIAVATAETEQSPDAGFKTCAALFCAAPLGIVGAILDGLSFSNPLAGSENFYPLAVKAAMDGLAAMGFASLFGWSVLLSVLPVLTFQGSISLVCARVLGPMLAAHGLAHSVTAVGGLLVFCVALVILGLKRVPLADYLPAVICAPLLALWWGW